ncbi:MAG TPA: glycosyltransferase [Steroidobacteraceae bacterium]|nr:glycosyltransferase [Steroidobacteraceae bacterium]
MSSRLVLFLPSLVAGGAERVFVDLANEFARQGHAVDLALAAAEGPFLSEVSRAVRVVDLRAGGVLRSLRPLARHLRRERPAAILSGLEHANIVSVAARRWSFTRTRVVVSTRGVPTMLGIEAGASSRTVLAVARVSYRLADAVIANSHGVADDMSRHLRLPRGRIQVIYNPLDLPTIEARAAADVAHPFAAPGAPPLVLAVGRFSPLKDFSTLLRAFAALRSRRDGRLVILGDGVERAALEALARELGVAADFALPGFDANPFAWMRRAAVFVSSSLSEGCPNALMQALACGTPVVTTDAVGGSAEIVEGGRWGRVVPVGDVAAMAAAIEATLGERTHPDGRARAADFSLPQVARQYLRVMLPAAEGR